jgi:hypothetical protein
MKMRGKAIYGLCLVFATCWGIPARAQNRGLVPPAPSQAQLEDALRRMTVQGEALDKSANEWMDLIDKGNYDEAWSNAGPSFQKMFSKDYWRGLMASRAVSGAIAQRELLSRDGRRQGLPGFPDARNVVVITYRVTFESGDESIEAVAVSMEGTTFKVVSYNRTLTPSVPSNRFRKLGV